MLVTNIRYKNRLYVFIFKKETLNSDVKLYYEIDLKQNYWQAVKKEKLPFLEHSNINPRAHLSKSRIHLNRNGSKKLGKNFVNFIVNHYA